MKKQNYKVIRFYILLGTGLALCLVVAACMNTSRTGVPANLQAWKKLSAQLDSAKKVMNSSIREHQEMVSEHSNRMGESNDSTHLRIENHHREFIENFRNDIQAHQMNVISLGELMSVKKPLEAGQEAADRKLIDEESEAIRKSMAELNDSLSKFELDHGQMLHSHR